MNSFLIIAHSPLASALRLGALHVFPDCGCDVVALDVLANAQPDKTVVTARALLAQLLARSPDEQVLILADVFGATPCNVAQKAADDPRTRLVAGANLPMLLRALSYRHEPMDALVQRAVTGGTSAVMEVAPTPQEHPSSGKNA